MALSSVKYIQDNFEEQDRLAVVLIDRSTRSVQQRLLAANEIVKDRFQAYLRASNATGRDIYISMNSLKPDAQGRTKNDIDQIRHLYLDIDCGGREALDRVLAAPELPEPHHVLNTSPDKFQAVWRVKGFEKDQAEKLLRGMAAAHGADPAATDCSRVLRIPGFRNCKYETHYYVKEIYSSQQKERVYGPRDFPDYPEPERFSHPMNDSSTEPSGKGSGAGSQSEKDFAYVRRALERGESPSELIVKVARFRHDKSNPQYYAERTVERAIQAHLRVARVSMLQSTDKDGKDRLPSR